MKQLFFILFLLPFSLSAMNKNEARQMVDSANVAYGNGETEAAATLYDSVLHVFASAEVHYNLGNCYFKLNDLPNAILNYERAWKLAPGDEDIYHNLRAADRQVVDEINALPMVDLGNSWRRFQAGEDRDQWAYLSLGLCLVAFGLLSFMVIAKRAIFKRISFILAAVVFVFCISSIVFATMRTQELKEHTKAVIFAPKVDIRSEPNDNSTRLLILHEGSKVVIEEEQGEWIEVRLPNGNGGWMRAANVEVI